MTGLWYLQQQQLACSQYAACSTTHPAAKHLTNLSINCEAQAIFLHLSVWLSNEYCYPYYCDLYVFVQLALTSIATFPAPSTLPARGVSLSSAPPQPSAPLYPAHSQRLAPS
jgi:hypothetical protein